MTARPDRSFLAPPDEVSDWRMLLVYDTAADAGVLSALPGTPAEVAQSRSLDERAVRVLLEVLVIWDILERDASGRYALGGGAPDADLAALLSHHARSIRMWAAKLDERLHGVASAGPPQPSPAQRRLWYAALAAYTRPVTETVVDACLARFRDARRVLDLGGGHGEHAVAFARRGLSVTMQDRPEAIDLARRDGRLEAAGVRLHAGDFFDDLAEGPFDIVFAAAVTDTYDPAHNAALSRLLHPIVASGGGVAILAFVRGRNRVVPFFAAQMLGVGSGGDTHAEEDYRRWLGEAGFGGFAVVDLPDHPQSLVFANR